MMIENGSISYGVVTTTLFVVMAMATFLACVVMPRLGRLKPVLYWWLYAVIASIGIISMASLYPMLNPTDVFAGLLVTIWLNWLWAVSVANLFAWVIVFHMTEGKWNTRP